MSIFGMEDNIVIIFLYHEAIPCRWSLCQTASTDMRSEGWSRPCEAARGLQRISDRSLALRPGAGQEPAVSALTLLPHLPTDSHQTRRVLQQSRAHLYTQIRDQNSSDSVNWVTSLFNWDWEENKLFLNWNGTFLFTEEWCINAWLRLLWTLNCKVYLCRFLLQSVEKHKGRRKSPLSAVLTRNSIEFKINCKSQYLEEKTWEKNDSHLFLSPVRTLTISTEDSKFSLEISPQSRQTCWGGAWSLWSWPSWRAPSTWSLPPHRQWRQCRQRYRRNTARTLPMAIQWPKSSSLQASRGIIHQG